MCLYQGPEPYFLIVYTVSQITGRPNFFPMFMVIDQLLLVLAVHRCEVGSVPILTVETVSSGLLGVSGQTADAQQEYAFESFH